MSIKTHTVIQVIYTDGSCMPNPGPGGWGFVALPCCNDKEPIEWHVSGGEDKSTNNRMELTAVIESLDFSNNTDYYRIHSDSMYVINCAKGIWSRKKNTDLWDIYEKVSKNKKIEWVWVKAHNGDKYNEIVDDLAKKEAKNKIK
jgi:ribonuclease HI